MSARPTYLPYSTSQFCEIDVSLLSLQNQPKTAPNLFERGVEYGKYALRGLVGEGRPRAELRAEDADQAAAGAELQHLYIYIYIYIILS